MNARPASPSLPASLLALLAFVLAGCAPRASGPAPVELRFWAMGREGEVVRELMPAFEAAHPGIRVRVQQIPWGAAHEKLVTAYVGDATPDVGQMGNTWIPEFVALDAIEPLTPFLGPNVRRASYFPGIWATNVVAGAPYGIPWYVDTRLIFYRRDVLERAGVARFPETWAQWEAALRAIKRHVGPDRYAIHLPLAEWTVPVLLGLQNGSGLLRDDGRYGAFAQAEYREAFRFYVSLFRNELVPPVTGSGVQNVYQDMAEGYFSMWVTGPWNLGEFKTRFPDSLQSAWATAPMPGPNGPGTSLAGGSSLVLFKGGRHPREAWTLIEWLSQPAQQMAFYRLTGSLPARREVWADTAFTNDPRIRAFGDQLERAVPTPLVPEWERITTSIMQYAEAAVRGSMTEDEALRRLDAEVDAMLEKRRFLLARSDE